MRAKPSDVQAVSERLEQRLAAGAWDALGAAESASDDEVKAAEIAAFALGLSGKRRAARRGGRLSRVLLHFALAATVTLSAVTAACGPSSSNGPNSAPAVDVATLVSVNATEVTLAAPTRDSPARFTDLVLVDPGGDTSPWAVLVPSTNAHSQPNPAPVLVDRQGAGLQAVGAVYSLPARTIVVGTRDGPSQFLDPLAPADQTAASFGGDAPGLLERVQAGWQRDERFQAATRAIAGRPAVLDAAYNAEAAVTAGGTHSYANGVVLRVDPDNAALQVIDRSLLESATPTRAEDLVPVAIRPDERSLYDPGTAVNLRDVVMERQQSTVNGQSATFYVANAALQGARVEPTGARVDLHDLLQTRLQRTDADLALQAQELSAPGAEIPATPVGQAQAQPTPTRPPTQPVQQPVVGNRYSGPSFVDDFLIWMWLSNSGFYRGPNVLIATPPPSSTRPTGDYYYVPPSSGTGSSSASTAASTAQSGSRSTALQSARSAVSGQASGTGGGTAATAKAAADSSARVSAATAKSASVAGDLSAASAGKSTAAAASGSSASNMAARSAGSVSAGSRGSAGSSGASGARGGASAGGFGSSGGGKGVSGSGSS